MWYRGSVLIAVSKGTASDPKYGRYAPWLSGALPGVETVDLSSLPPREALAALERADGLLLTGGADIDPGSYGAPEARDCCIAVDPARDEKEFAWLDAARRRGLPVLAVCRGMQLVNVSLGGTLHPHIPSAFPAAVDHRAEGGDASHAVRLEPGSLLERLAGGNDAVVNSSHHQALRDVAEELRVTARAPDGVAEAVEWRSPAGRPFFLGVQWHPERQHREEPLSLGVARAFLEAVSARARSR